MAFEEREGQGSLWNNDNKNADNHPDYRGTFTLNGVPHVLAGWKKQTQDGVGFVSLAVQTKAASDAKREAAKQTQPAPQGQQQDTSACDAIRAQISRLATDFGVPEALQIANSRGFPSWLDVKHCVDVARLTTLKQDLDKQVNAAAGGDGIPF